MNLIETVQSNFQNYLKSNFNYDSVNAPIGFFELNIDDKKQAFGDINSNIALILSKKLSVNSIEIAQQISTEFKDSLIEKIEIAGPGFINIFLSKDTLQQLAKQLHEQGENFYKNLLAKTESYSIEFVSGNPTGPLHIGNGRGGVIGDVLANVLKFLGHDVTKEYYINDAGVQIKKLGLAFKIRCLQQLGQKIDLPEDSYKGEYLIDLSKECIKEYSASIVERPEEFFEEYAKNKILKMIKQTLHDYGVDYNVWFSETSLHKDGSIAKAIEKLTNIGLTFEQDGAIWFKSTEFGDDKDREIKKADGDYAYIAPDIAYMLNKAARGSTHIVLTLGQDHHSYAARLHAIHKALGLDKTTKLDIILYQLVHLNTSGETMRLSKRAGNIISLREIIDIVGKDVARFFFLNRKADAQLDFDLDLALKHTDENPVYYIQYAYVRTNSILSKADTIKEFKDISSKDLDNLDITASQILKKIIHLKTLLLNINQ